MILTGQKVEFPMDELPELYGKQYYVFLKVVVLLVFCYESQFKLIASGSFNDDYSERPELHGAYKVIEGSKSTWEMIYFHRQGYFIVEDKEGVFYDFKLNVDRKSQLLQLTTYELEKQVLEYKLNKDTLTINDSDSGFVIKALKVYTYNSKQLN